MFWRLILGRFLQFNFELLAFAGDGDEVVICEFTPCPLTLPVSCSMGISRDAEGDHFGQVQATFVQTFLKVLPSDSLARKGGLRLATTRICNAAVAALAALLEG